MSHPSQSEDSKERGIPVAVIGFGNPLRGDDGIVPVLFDRIRSQELPSEITLLEFGARSFRLVHALRDFDRVLLVDAMCFDGEPGAVAVCTPEQVASRAHDTGLHGIDLLEIVSFAREYAETPTAIRIFGVQPGPTDIGDGLSDGVKSQLPEITSRLLETIEALGSEGADLEQVERSS